MPNRVICSVLEEMRQAYETRNFSYLLGLIEEAQSMANVMEAAIYDIQDIKRFKKERAELRKEIEELRKKVPKSQEKTEICS